VRQPQFNAKAKRVVHFFMNGGPSHVDTFDPKPMLTKMDGKALPNMLKTERPTGAGLKSPFSFKKYGQCGLEVSELFSNVGEFADDLCVIRSMHADVPNHEPSLGLMNCGDGRLARPSLGSWVTYGLGTENQNLPGYVSMCPVACPRAARRTGRAPSCPACSRGPTSTPKTRRVWTSWWSSSRTPAWTSKQQRKQLDLLHELNERHLKSRQNDTQLEARVQSYELAYRMQMEATDAFDIGEEPEWVRKEYGDSDFGRQCLIARRLLERGVRFLQLWTGAGQAPG